MFEEPIRQFEVVTKSTEAVNDFKVVSKEGFQGEIRAVSDKVFRIRISSKSHPLPPHDNVILTESDFKGKMTLVEDTWENMDGHFLFKTNDDIEVSVSHPEDTLVYQIKQNGKQVYQDTPGRSFSTNGPGITHYVYHEEANIHLGLGERGAPLDLSYRNFKLHGLDSAFYDAYHTDTLYKVNPILFSLSKGEGWCIGEFSTSNSKGEWNIGGELDRYWGPYRVMRQDHGGLEKFIIVGKSLDEVVTEYAKIVGFPLLPSRHFLGYLASGVGYSFGENPSAQQVLTEFPEVCKKYDIPCSAMHLSSGYCQSIEKHPRHVAFFINKKRFPDMAKLCKMLRESGIQIAVNVKPFIPVTHEDFDYLKSAKALFIDPKTGEPPALRNFDVGVFTEKDRLSCWVDLSTKVGYEWWVRKVSELLNMGIDVVWNDNNEYSLINDSYLCQWEKGYSDSSTDIKGPQTVGLTGRLHQTQLMAKGSHEALSKVFPDRRPMIVTRSANVGTQRYAASSWSGDNETSWRTLKGNTIMALNAGLSLLTSFGSDVGGFVGDVPTPELFMRWVQVGIFNPRFSIHSVGSDEKTEPWMYPEILPQIRACIKRRYELIPYLYALHWEAHQTGRPLNRWLGWGPYETDKELYKRDLLESADFWLGSAFLICGVFEPGVTERTVYLPSSGSDEYYYLLSDPESVYASGETVTVSTPLDHIAIFAKSGSIVPIGKPAVTGTTYVNTTKAAEADNWRGVEVYPVPANKSNGQQFEYQWTEDDGESVKISKSVYNVTVKCFESHLEVSAKALEDGYKQPWGNTLWVVLPVNDGRKVKGAMEQKRSEKGTVYGVSL